LWNEARYLEENEENEDFYREENRRALIDDDELTPTEAGFMKGYEEAI
jgi:hypothetical protein